MAPRTCGPQCAEMLRPNHPLTGLAVIAIWCGMILGLIASI